METCPRMAQSSHSSTVKGCQGFAMSHARVEFRIYTMDSPIIATTEGDINIKSRKAGKQ